MCGQGWAAMHRKIKPGVFHGGTHSPSRCARLPPSVGLLNIGEPLFSVNVVIPVATARLLAER